MASIGPQLPPHFQKRKRTPEDDAELGSPPPKTSRRDDEDEIPLDSDSDDDFGPRGPELPNKNPTERIFRPGSTIGPSLPPAVVNSNTASPTGKRQPIGPSLPQTVAQTNSDEIALDSDDNDGSTGPAPPSATAGPASPPKRVLGPAPPPAALSERPTTNPDSDSDSSDDDDWGPALPGASTNSRTAAGPSLLSPSQPEPVAPKRDDWMLAPPTSSGPRAPDPTKLKARKFASGPRAATAAKPSGISSIWTETPEEKARRLANAVLGREDPNNPATQAGGGARPEASVGGGGSGNNSRADDARIKSFIEQTRGRSLVEEHQASRAAGKVAAAAKLVKGDDSKWGKKGGDVEDDDDDPSKRAFDWEKDMKVGGSISNSQRKELLNRAANFGGRFQSGKYL